jgi:glutamate synthase domain-containing protein 3
VLRDWDEMMPKFVKVMPRDYKRVLKAQAKAAAVGREASFMELVGAGNG